MTVVAVLTLLLQIYFFQNDQLHFICSVFPSFFVPGLTNRLYPSMENKRIYSLLSRNYTKVLVALLTLALARLLAT